MVSKMSILLLAAAFAVATAGHHGHGGHSNSYRKQDDWGNYAFGYDIKDPWGASNFRKEQGDASGAKWGSYGLQDVDGRWRTVEYVADKGGFRAAIKTNEPGTGNADAAQAIYNGADPHGHSNTNVAAGHHAPNYNDGGHGHGHKKAA